METEYAISSTVSRLRELLTQTTIASLGVNEQVQNLVSDLEAIRYFIVDTDQKQDKDKQIGKLLLGVEDIYYEAEVLESYALKVAARRTGDFKDVLQRYFCIFGDMVARHNVAVRIRSLTERIDGLFKAFQSHGLKRATEVESSTGAHRRHLVLSGTSYLFKKEKIVGLKDETERIVSILLSEDHPLISIWGNGGSGKTTLAKLVYKHDEIRRYFEGFAWVVLGLTDRTKSVLRHALLQLIPELSEEIMHFEDITLVQKLSDVLHSKKCLLVLDNIWTRKAWESFRVALVSRKTDSKVLITTCQSDVACEYFGHKNRFLTKDESLDLLMTKAIPDGCPAIKHDTKVQKAVYELVTECGGHPLSIIIIGSLLASKSLSDWETMARMLAEKRPADTESLTDGFIEIMRMAYNGLPRYLKPCFLYLGLFPADSEIEAEKLFLCWMAEGIIPSGQREETVMELGRCYLDALAATSLVDVQIDEVPTVGRFKCCSLHNIIRDFCLLRAHMIDFFTITILPDNVSSAPLTTRGLVFYLNPYEDGYPCHLKREISRLINELDHLRSLFFLNAYHDEYTLWPEGKFSFGALRFLRVLHFDGYSFQTRILPEGIEKLVNLRYLSVVGCYLRELQSGIGNLLNLETLDLRVTTSCKMTIPNVLWKLEKLRHLYLPVAFQPKGDDKLNFAGLRELQILKNFDTKHCHAQDLLELTNIRILDATTWGNNEDLKAIIEFMKKTSLRQSTIYVRNFDCYSRKRRSIVTELFSCSGLHTLHIDGHIERLPQINSSGLTKLSFIGSELLEDPMATLGNLPNLWVLELCDAAFLGEVIVCSASGFPELRRLELSGLHKLQMLTIEEGATPNLTTLVIERCKRVAVPRDGLRFLAKLQELKIAMMPIEFEDGLREMQKELYEVHQGLAINFVHDSHEERSAEW